MFCNYNSKCQGNNRDLTMQKHFLNLWMAKKKIKKWLKTNENTGRKYLQICIIDNEPIFLIHRDLNNRRKKRPKILEKKWGKTCIDNPTYMYIWLIYLKDRINSQEKCSLKLHWDTISLPFRLAKIQKLNNILS